MKRLPRQVVLGICAGLALSSLASVGRSEIAVGPARPDPAAVYVDARAGRDSNPGTRAAPVRTLPRGLELVRSRDHTAFTLRLEPGVYLLEQPLVLATAKDTSRQRLVLEASVLPDNPAWAPEKMPVIMSSCPLGAVSPEAASFAAALLVQASHVTIRGLNFHGYPWPNARYFPIARLDKSTTDLLVEQCLFAGDATAARIQVGVIAHGDRVRVRHCVFHGVHNAVVFWEDAGTGDKTGNELTDSVIVGATQSAVWTSWPDRDFAFRNNIVTGCKHVWVTNAENPARYTMEHCVVIGNQHRTGVAHSDGVRPEDFALAERDVVHDGEVRLRLMTDMDAPLPRDYLHAVAGSAGFGTGAGLFMQ